MISHRYHGSAKLHFLLKQITGYFIYWAVVWFLHLFVYKEDLLPANYVWMSFLVPASAYLEKMARASNRQSLCGLSKEQIANITQREIIFALVTVFGVIVMIKDPTASRAFLAIFFTLYAAWIIWMNHTGHRKLQRYLYRNQEKGKTKTLVLASPREIERDQAMRVTSILPGSDVMGYVAFGGTPTSAAIDMATFPVLGDFRDLARICKDYGARMLLATGIEDRPSLVQSLQQMCDSYGMRLVWVDDKEHKFKGKIDAYKDGNRVYVTNWSEPLEDPMMRFYKRIVDLSFSLLIACTVFPVLCFAVWILQKKNSPGPMFYSQKRTGRNGEVFEVLKFRSMHVNDNAGIQAKKGDSRIFPGGNFLRKSSLDEIPQFINVLKGQMSVVGPRPHFVDHDQAFEKIVDDYAVRYFAKPGITGLAQTKGCRGETDTDLKVRQRVRFDNFYLRNWTPWMDIKIILATAWQVIFPPQSAR
ncbi:MAG: exopolysaccharide biosynthesis polyprenyl glycosylphosphotransferase [Verrucomicrobiales bacterium]|nr:exopolysaccharide biosynthesis polyprenyl glycosylphosphotransferase [Verrucomicrobiales bacterium]